jgi:hypothetical protein
MAADFDVRRKLLIRSKKSQQDSAAGFKSWCHSMTEYSDDRLYGCSAATQKLEY